MPLFTFHFKKNRDFSSSTPMNSSVNLFEIDFDPILSRNQEEMRNQNQELESQISILTQQFNNYKEYSQNLKTN